MSAIVNVVLPIFGLILAGYVCRRSGRLGETASNELSRFVVWLALPALLFNVTATASWEQLWQPGFIASVCAGCALVFAATVALRVRKSGRLVDASIDGLSAAYANTGFLGIPLCALVFGDAGLMPAIVATLIVACLLFAVGIVLVEIGLFFAWNTFFPATGFDAFAVAVALVSFVALVRFKLSMHALVGLSGLAGLLWQWIW